MSLAKQYSTEATFMSDVPTRAKRNQINVSCFKVQHLQGLLLGPLQLLPRRSPGPGQLGSARFYQLWASCTSLRETVNSFSGKEVSAPSKLRPRALAGEAVVVAWFKLAEGVIASSLG